jgi:hypothetical protein
MKSASGLILLMFLFFLATPTIVSLIEKTTDTSYFYNMTEEELSHKEIKAELKFHTDYIFTDLSGYTSSLIISENLSKHDNIAATIFIPPPEQA